MDFTDSFVLSYCKVKLPLAALLPADSLTVTVTSVPTVAAGISIVIAGAAADAGMLNALNAIRSANSSARIFADVFFMLCTSCM